jgi:hypothetical protein
VVDEVLLGLVEDQAQVDAEAARPRRELVGQRPGALRPAPGGPEQLLPHGRPQLCDHVAAPRGEDDDRELAVTAGLDVLPVEGA